MFDELRRHDDELRRIQTQQATASAHELFEALQRFSEDVRRFERRMFSEMLDAHLRAYRGYGMRAMRPTRDTDRPGVVLTWSPRGVYDKHFYPFGYWRHLDEQLLALEGK